MNKNLRKTKAKLLATNKINSREAAVLDHSGVQKADAIYDFAVDGGAAGVIDLTVNLPADAVVTAVYSDEQTACTTGGGSATLQLKAGATALTDALAFDTAFTGIDSQALASSATGIKVSAAAALSLTIATADLTAGKVRFAVHYYISK